MEEEKKVSGVKRRRLFAAEDDKQLEQIINRNDFKGWKNVAKEMPGFSPKQLRDRWHNYISPKNQFGPWTEEEDQIIIQKVKEYGTKWSFIASFLKGRSDNCVKNRWNSVLRDKIAAEPKHYSSNMPFSPKYQLNSIPQINGLNQTSNQISKGLYLDPRFVDLFFEKEHTAVQTK